MAISRRTWRNPWLWPATQLAVLLFPLVTALRLAAELHSEMDGVIGIELIVPLVSTWAALCGLVLGAGAEMFVPAAQREDPEAKLAAVSWRMLAVLVVVPLSLAIIQPPRLLDLGPEWRDIAVRMATVAVPIWAGTLLARSRGLGPLRTLLLVPAWGGAVLGAAVVAGRLAYLDDSAAQAVVAAAGVVGSIGLYLAVTERVTASLSRVLLSVGSLAVAICGAMILWFMHPPAELAWVEGLGGVSAASGEIFFDAQEPNRLTRIFALQTASGEIRRLPHGIRIMKVLGDQQLTSHPSARLPFLDRTTRMCATRRGEEERCLGPAFPYEGTHIDVHGALPLALMVTRHAILVWDLGANQAWQVARPEAVVRWPCFDDAGGLIWRLQTAEGPFLQERLVLGELPPGDASDPPEVSALARPLPMDHRFQCRPARPHTVGRLVRGRTLMGRPHVLFGPGLPGGRVELDSLSGESFWSDDGGTFLFKNDEQHLRFYRPEFGLSAPLLLPRETGSNLSPNGALLAHFTDAGPGGFPLLVRDVPDGTLLMSTTSDTPGTTWIGDDAVLVVRTGRLIRVDVPSGEETVLFPPPDRQAPVGP